MRWLGYSVWLILSASSSTGILCSWLLSCKCVHKRQQDKVLWVVSQILFSWEHVSLLCWIKAGIQAQLLHFTQWQHVHGTIVRIKYWRKVREAHWAGIRALKSPYIAPFQFLLLHTKKLCKHVRHLVKSFIDQYTQKVSEINKLTIPITCPYWLGRHQSDGEYLTSTGTKSRFSMLLACYLPNSGFFPFRITCLYKLWFLLLNLIAANVPRLNNLTCLWSFTFLSCTAWLHGLSYTPLSLCSSLKSLNEGYAYELHKSWTLDSWSQTAESQGNYKVKVPPGLGDNQIQASLLILLKWKIYSKRGWERAMLEQLISDGLLLCILSE